ncbi:hypothetical protein AAEX28_01835 [Lentisphaerota bacterium WC36G]|nr:glycosyltransferase family 39 protein [Lentisphaerae bacterium WC36]UDQ98842.1 glycosyltransferase family 39 protein [Lentisphaerae bacterium WC36]
MKKERKILWSLFGAFFLLSIVLSIIDVIPARDVAFRYAPMAEAFARGDWDFAFHPRVPMALPLMAGIVCFVFKCSGFMACKIISSLFYSLTVFPIYGISIKVFKKNYNIALTSVISTGFCSHLIRLGYSGLRDSLKEFAIILAVYGIVKIYQNREKLSGYIYGAVGMALLVTCRVDAVLFAIIIGLTMMIFDIFASKLRFPWRTIIAAVTCLAIISPNLIYNYRTIGYPVSEARLAVIMDKVVPQICNKNAKLSLHQATNGKNEEKKVNSSISGVQKKVLSQPLHDIKSGGENDFGEYLKNIFTGCYPYYLFLALIVIVYRIKRKLWTKEETILLSGCVIHTFGILAQIKIFHNQYYVSPRYLLPAMPLYFGWVAIGALFVINFLRQIVNIKLIKFIIIIGMFGLIADGAGPLIKSYTSSKKSMRRQHSLFVAKVITDDFKQRNISKFYKPNLNIFSYITNYQPFIYSNDLNTISYLSKGNCVGLKNISNADYIVYSYRKKLKEQNHPQIEEDQFNEYVLLKKFCTYSRGKKYSYVSKVYFNNWRSINE